MNYSRKCMAETLVYNHNHDVSVWHKKVHLTITGETTVCVPVVLLKGTSPSLNTITEKQSQSK